MTDNFPTFRRGGERIRADVFPTFRRFGRWWWRGTCRFVRRLPVILLVLLVVLGTPWTILNIKYGRELERELANLRAQGKPLTLVEATTRPVPPEENAAPLYQALFGVEWRSDNQGVRTEKGLLGLTPEETRTIVELQKQEQRPVTHRERQEREGRMMNAAVKFLGQDEALAKVREASLRPHAVFPVNWEDGPGALFPHLAKFRDAARLVVFCASVEMNSGDADSALDRLATVVRMTSHAAEDPTLINQLVAYAMDAIVFDTARLYLDVAPASPAAMARLSEALSRREFRPGFVRAMEGERAMGLDVFDLVRKSSALEFAAMVGWVADHFPLPTVLKLYASPLADPWRKLDELYYIRRMQGDIELASRPWRESKAELEHRWGSGPGSTSYAGEDYYRRPPSPMLIISSMLLPVFSRASEKCDWAQAQTNLLQTALALKIYRAQHGAYPATLSGLAVPDDPFSGKAFVYRRQGAGFRLYSLGPDLKDNKGQPILFGKDRRTPPESESGWDGDIVWVSRR